jgi:RNA polymerase sigma factor (sigma-70 family)
MPDVKDMDLIREYADRDSEPAFAELVHQYINLVYSVALRYAGNSQDAQDVTQAVFIVLAQKAASLRQRPTLTGWLYETTRFTAKRFLRTNIRRQFREQEAYMQSTLNESDTDGVWRQLAPLLEEAMTRLNEKERTLLALRFFENKSGAEAAALLGIEVWAVRKRVERAVEKLRTFFAWRGIRVSTGILTAAISANSVQAAPVALAKSVTAVAVAKSAAASGSTLTLIKGTLKILALRLFWLSAQRQLSFTTTETPRCFPGRRSYPATRTRNMRNGPAQRQNRWQRHFLMPVVGRIGRKSPSSGNRAHIPSTTNSRTCMADCKSSVWVNRFGAESSCLAA